MKLSILNSSVVSGDSYCIDNANFCNFILSQRVFFVFHKLFFCTETFVGTADGQQNRHHFPILCSFTQALVDLTNIPGFLFHIEWDISSSREKVVKKIVSLKHFCFCAPCLTVGAVPLLKLSRNRESANVKVLYFVGSD